MLEFTLHPTCKLHMQKTHIWMMLMARMQQCGSCCTETHSEVGDLLHLLVQQLCRSIKLYLGLLGILLSSLSSGHKSLHLLHLHVSGRLCGRVCICIQYNVEQHFG